MCLLVFFYPFLSPCLDNRGWGVFLLLCKPFGFALLIFSPVILKEVICHKIKFSFSFSLLLWELAIDAGHLDGIGIILTAQKLGA